MAVSRDPILKKCRSLGVEPAYLGYSKKSNKNPKSNKRKVSEYGLQLKEKQKTKFIYGVLERQFRSYFDIASNKKGITGDNLLQLLESRLDNVVFRLGFAATRPQARQMVSHAQFEVNGKKVNIPSYRVKPGDVVSVRENKKENNAIKNSIEVNKNIAVPTWLEKDEEKLTGKVLRLPAREEIDVPVEEHLIVELYSK